MTETATTQEPLMTTAQLAEYLTGILGVTVAEETLRVWRYRRTGPNSFKIGHRVYYRPEAVRAWIAECEKAGMPTP